MKSDVDARCQSSDELAGAMVVGLARQSVKVAGPFFDAKRHLRHLFHALSIQWVFVASMLGDSLAVLDVMADPPVVRPERHGLVDSHGYFSRYYHTPIKSFVFDYRDQRTQVQTYAVQAQKSCSSALCPCLSVWIHKSVLSDLLLLSFIDCRREAVLQ